MNDPVEAAVRVASILGSSALWDGNRCTWVTDTSIAADRQETHLVSPVIYDGQAGIVRFLADCALVSGDRVVAQLAHAAVDHLLVQATDHPSERMLSYYSGWAGVADVLARCAVALEREDCRNAAHSIARETLACTPEPSANGDFMSGTAARLLAAQRVEELTGDPGAVHVIEREIRTLLSSSVGTNGIANWSDGRGQALTGLAHGNAGISYALARSLAWKSSSDLVSTLERALAFERAKFDAVRKNWPDLRSSSGFMTAWCHGAPGIALSRLGIQAATSHVDVAHEICDGIETTQSWIASVVQDDRECNLSLCHGLSGNLLIVAEHRRALGSPLSPLEGEAVDLVIRRLKDAEHRSDLFGSLTVSPSLFLGFAGVGHALLRMAAPDLVHGVLLAGGDEP